jgi:hypothetical protein
MHPALSLAKRKLDDLEAEFNQVMAIEAEVVPQLTTLGTQAALSAKSSLRATGIEGVYTGIEGVLKEILTVVDGGVFAGAESWHAHLLAQAAAPNDEKRRPALISEKTYRSLDRLRSFRHIERNLYRHLLREREVAENLERLTLALPLFKAEIGMFLANVPEN